MKMKSHVLTILACLPIAIICVVIMQEANGIKAPANVYPMAIMITMLCLSIIAIIKAAVSHARRVSKEIVLGTPSTWITVIAILVYALAMQYDYLSSTSVFMLLLFLKHHKKPLSALSIAKCVLISISVTAFVYLTFVVWLGVDVPVLWQ